MAEKSAEQNLIDLVKKYLEVYRILSPEARVTFEVEIVKKTRDMDERTRNLYGTLIKAAKDGLDTDEAIIRMKKVK